MKGKLAGGDDGAEGRDMPGQRDSGKAEGKNSTEEKKEIGLKVLCEEEREKAENGN